MKASPTSIAQEQETFPGSDGVRLFERRWHARAKRRTVAVAVIHGYAEHCGRYDRLAAALVHAGYAVEAFDLRGHGQSDGERVLFRSLDVVLDDVSLWLDGVRERSPGAPFLFGHSMGGLLAAALAVTRPVKIRGLLLSSPALTPGPHVHPWTVHAGKWLGRHVPRMPAHRISAKHISRDQEVVRQYREDPLVHHGFMPAGTAAAILTGIDRVTQQARALEVPLLAMVGTDDRLAEPIGSERLVERASSPDKTLRRYEGLYHELLNEPERERVLADMVAWLDEHA